MWGVLEATTFLNAKINPDMDNLVPKTYTKTREDNTRDRQQQ